MTATRDDRLARAVRAYESRDLEAARAAFLELRAEFPGDATIAAYTAWTHDSLGLEEEAVPHYEAAAAGDLPDEQLRGVMLGLGSTLRALGRDEESQRVFDRAIARFPDDRALRVFRAMLAYNRGDARDGVADLIRILLETTSDVGIQRYRRALAAYAEDLDRSWLK